MKMLGHLHLYKEEGQPGENMNIKNHTEKTESAPSEFCSHIHLYCLFSVLLTFILRLVLEPVNDSTLILTLWPLLTTSATFATRPSRRSSEMWTSPSQRFLREENNDMVDFTGSEITSVEIF